MTQKATNVRTLEKSEELLSLPIPKHGIRIRITDRDGEVWVFVLRPWTRQAYSLAKQGARSGKGLEAAIGIINMLKVDGCPNPDDMEDVMALATLEEALANWMEAADVEVKKN